MIDVYTYKLNGKKNKPHCRNNSKIKYQNLEKATVLDTCSINNKNMVITYIYR